MIKSYIFKGLFLDSFLLNIFFTLRHYFRYDLGHKFLGWDFIQTFAHQNPPPTNCCSNPSPSWTNVWFDEGGNSRLITLPTKHPQSVPYISPWIMMHIRYLDYKPNNVHTTPLCSLSMFLLIGIYCKSQSTHLWIELYCTQILHGNRYREK